MLKSPYKTIETESGAIKIFGNNHDIEIEYSVPDWEGNGELHACFKYKNYVYYLSEFMGIDNTGSPMAGHGFDGYHSDSFFSGVLVKYTEDFECIRAYTFIS
jgi:hypothetical protein